MTTLKAATKYKKNPKARCIRTVDTQFPWSLFASYNLQCTVYMLYTNDLFGVV